MTSSKATAIRYVIDSGVSRVDVRVFAAGLLSAFGHNPMISDRGLQRDAEVADDGWKALLRTSWCRQIR